MWHQFQKRVLMCRGRDTQIPEEKETTFLWHFEVPVASERILNL